MSVQLNENCSALLPYSSTQDYTVVPFNANGATLLYTVPADKRCVLTHAIVVAGADAGASTTFGIGSETTTYVNFLAAHTLSNLDAENDAVILRPVPNLIVLKGKSYVAGTAIYGIVAAQSGGPTNRVYLFGFLYDA
jgi:hypothetical protein